MAIEEEFGIEIPDAEADEITTVAQGEWAWRLVGLSGPTVAVSAVAVFLVLHILLALARHPPVPPSDRTPLVHHPAVLDLTGICPVPMPMLVPMLMLAAIDYIAKV